MGNARQDLLVQWERLVNRLIFLEKRYVFRSGELKLYPSELHVLLAVRQEPEMNATELARRLGVTKGAVSQVMKRLEGKGVLGKRHDPYQKNELTVFFTPLGQQAVEAFLAQRAEAGRRFRQHLDSLSDEESRTIQRFLDSFGSLLEELE